MSANGFIVIAHNGDRNEATWTIYSHADQVNARADTLAEDFKHVFVYELGRKLR